MVSASAYTELTDLLHRLDRLSGINAVLGWDEQVNLPPASAQLRGEQLSAYADLLHRERTNPRIGELLDTLESGELEPDAQVVVRDARRQYDEATRLPAEFVRRVTEASSNGYHAWVAARKANDFASYAPFLENNLALVKEQAAIFEAARPYDYWLDQFDPGLTEEIVTKLFAPLPAAIREIVDVVEASPVKPRPERLQGFDVPGQEKFLREIITAFGFDFSRGRMDVAVHPFCGGHPLDTRLTTRYDVNDPINAIAGAMHEAGHGMYEQGLPQELPGTALADAVGMAFHESQSRTWENNVGRSRAFWNHWEPRFREIFPAQTTDLTSEELFLCLNTVRVSPIRTESDEVTYNLHIILRYEMERRLFSGDVAVKDLPAAWNEASARIVGYTPRNDTEGCLQDVHWSGLMFGYFPSYCVGNLIAGQLWEQITQDLPDVDAQIGRGEYAPLLAWLRTNVHAQGKRFYTMDLVKRLTGRELSAAPLVQYLRERYLPLYT